MSGQSAAASEARSQVFFMLISAGIFAYFGFGMGWNHYSVLTGEFLLFVALLDWTLKVSAVAFGLSAVVAMVHAMWGNLLYSVFGLLSAIMFAIVGIMDVADTQHQALSPILLFIFAAWNGYGSWTGLREVLAWRAAASQQRATFTPPSSSSSPSI